jgi:hypothetical protein
LFTHDHSTIPDDGRRNFPVMKNNSVTRLIYIITYGMSDESELKEKEVANTMLEREAESW